MNQPSKYVAVFEAPTPMLCDVCRYGPLPMRRALTNGNEIWLCPEHNKAFEDWRREQGLADGP